MFHYMGDGKRDFVHKHNLNGYGCKVMMYSTYYFTWKSMSQGIGADVTTIPLELPLTLWADCPS